MQPVRRPSSPSFLYCNRDRQVINCTRTYYTHPSISRPRDSLLQPAQLQRIIQFRDKQDRNRPRGVHKHERARTLTSESLVGPEETLKLDHLGKEDKVKSSARAICCFVSVGRERERASAWQYKYCSRQVVGTDREQVSWWA